MLVRLLLAVLTVAGPVPVRVCTCATAAETTSPAPLPGPTVSEPAQGCGCKRHQAEAGPAAEASAQMSCHVRSDSHPVQDPDQHERGCPSASPRPVMTEGAATAVDSPADAAAVSLLPFAKIPGSRLLMPPDRSTSRLPLPIYLSLLSIRI